MMVKNTAREVDAARVKVRSVDCSAEAEADCVLGNDIAGIIADSGDLPKTMRILGVLESWRYTSIVPGEWVRAKPPVSSCRRIVLPLGSKLYK